MSHDIFETDKVLVTAYVGKEGEPCTQIGMKGNHGYEQLDRKQSLELAHALLSRILGKDGYQATD